MRCKHLRRCIMGLAKWFVYILSFFLPIFGFVTFWAFVGRGDELNVVAVNSLIASFVGVAVLITVAAVGLTMFEIPWGWPGM